MNPYSYEVFDLKLGDDTVKACHIIDSRGPRFIGGSVCYILPRGESKVGDKPSERFSPEAIAEKIVTLLNEDFNRNGTGPFSSSLKW